MFFENWDPVDMTVLAKEDQERIWKAAAARGPHTITITGATGLYAPVINGVYDQDFVRWILRPRSPPMYRRRTPGLLSRAGGYLSRLWSQRRLWNQRYESVEQMLECRETILFLSSQNRWAVSDFADTFLCSVARVANGVLPCEVNGWHVSAVGIALQEQDVVPNPAVIVAAGNLL